MAINGTDAIRSLGPETRVVPARPARSHDSSKREGGTPARTASAEASQEAPRAKRIPLPDFAGQNLTFRHDEELNRVIVEVVDVKTREVVRTIPPEEIVNALRSIREAQGALLDEEA